MRLDVNNVSKKFGKVIALDNFSATFETGHIYGLIGRNGAGKSTLLNIITDRVYADSSDIKMDGVDVKNNDKLLSLIHLMNDSIYYFDDNRCITQIKWIEQIVPYFDSKKAQALAAKFNLNLKKVFKGLSTGNRTIFKDIIALSMNVPFIFFDEPTLGLDAVARSIFYSEVATLFANNPDTCIVISTHLIEEIEPLVDQFYMINNGKNLLGGDKDEIEEKIYVARGREELVREYIKGKKVLSEEKVLGGYEAVVKGDKDEVEGVEIIKPSLQQLFIKLVGGSNNV